MPSIDDVYRRFGETAEEAQLLEAELGNMLLEICGKDENLFNQLNQQRAGEICDQINRHTLGRIMKHFKEKGTIPSNLEATLFSALQERNRLSHAFYRQHTFRRNSVSGRAIMLADLDAIYNTLDRAYRDVLLLRGIDLDTMGGIEIPTDHVKI